MSKVDWSKAPDGAEWFAGDHFYRNVHGAFYFLSSPGFWQPSLIKSVDELRQKSCFEPRPQQWPDESRIDTIGTNGNDGEHYMKIYQLNEESMHYDEFQEKVSTGPAVYSKGNPSVLGITKNKYQRDIVGLDGTKTVVDVYRVLDAFKTDSAAIDHAVKKLLAPGLRHSKDRKQDLQEAIDSIAAELLLMEQK